ncbi:hypothetical protein CHS0354_003790 [Potamilus streckersoni]|uniref:Uncharacterized protein n=1 Tax=Potamilus streckersoni TaxID=2493646 RepID=A0AAE0T2Y1_9BIVA|nr:hypothetical protein CHS0354_003790 [Potamilus streckersoni]
MLVLPLAIYTLTNTTTSTISTTTSNNSSNKNNAIIMTKGNRIIHSIKEMALLILSSSLLCILVFFPPVYVPAFLLLPTFFLLLLVVTVGRGKSERKSGQGKGKVDRVKWPHCVFVLFYPIPFGKTGEQSGRGKEGGTMWTGQDDLIRHRC